MIDRYRVPPFVIITKAWNPSGSASLEISDLVIFDCPQIQTDRTSIHKFLTPPHSIYLSYYNVFFPFFLHDEIPIVTKAALFCVLCDLLRLFPFLVTFVAL
jgi:hypothetical protein